MINMLKKFKTKLLRKIWLYLHLLVKKTAIVIVLFYEICDFAWIKFKFITIVALKVLYVIFVNIKYYFFKIKLHLYDNLFCVVVYYVWVNFGFRWVFYNVLNHYHWNGLLAYWWFYLPDHLYYLITEEYYYKLKISIWFFKRNIRVFRKREVFYILKYQKFFANEKKDILKVCIYIFSCVFITALFIKFVFINIFNALFLLILKRIISFIISSFKYFILFLKFRCYFFFLKHSNKFNLNKKRKYKKIKSFLLNEYFYNINDFDWSYFFSIIKSFLKTKDIFMYYKFRKDLIWYSYSKKKKIHSKYKLYNRVLYRLIKKNKLFFRKQRWVIWIQDLWLYSTNFNFFYFYKSFFFFVNFIYSSAMYLLDAHLDLYLKILMYLAA